MCVCVCVCVAVTILELSVFVHMVCLDNTTLFSSLIARTAQDIDILIDSLPSQGYTQNHQDEALRKLEGENRHAAEKLRQAVEEGGEIIGTEYITA